MSTRFVRGRRLCDSTVASVTMVKGVQERLGLCCCMAIGGQRDQASKKMVQQADSIPDGGGTLVVVEILFQTPPLRPPHSWETQRGLSLMPIEFVSLSGMSDTGLYQWKVYAHRRRSECVWSMTQIMEMKENALCSNALCSNIYILEQYFYQSSSFFPTPPPPHISLRPGLVVL